MTRNKGTIQWRLGLIRVSVVLLTFVLLLRLFTLQVAEHGYYSALAAAQHDASSVLTPERGNIYVQDRGEENGGRYPVAVNRKAENLVISPRDIADSESAAKVIAQIVGADEQELLAVLKQKQKRYYVVKKDLGEAEASSIQEGKENGTLPKSGVWLESEVKRFYPEGELLSHVLGFVGIVNDGKSGIYGLEKYFNELLAGSEGRLEAAKDPGGNQIVGSLRKLAPAINGSNLSLTIERAIQVESEKILKNSVEKFGADGGQVIVANPKTGAIWALASAPGFNPNEYNKIKDIKFFVNPAVQARYEPGSIMKPITMAAGLETSSVQPDDTYVDTGSVRIGGYTIQNSDNKSYGRQSMIGVLEKSLNTGAVFVQQKMGKAALKEFLEKFGFGEKTGITLPGEVSGDIRNLNTESDIAFATASFGQGISVTPMELVQAFTAIAGKGEMKKLHIVSEIDHPNGSREVVQPQMLRRVISEVTAVRLSSMMVNVVENGHGKRAKVPGYWIAGKTGTAQVPLEEARGYDPNKTIGSFIGFGPVEDPAFVMLVKIDNPKGVKFAESTAAPAFGEIAKFILDYLQITPTRTLE